MDCKRCKWCKETKNIAEFVKDKSRPRGFSTECKYCANKRGREYYKHNKDKLKLTYLKKTYGLDEEAYKSLLLNQKDKCNVCGEKLPLHVDHDHTTGKVRGLLCSNCNIAIGLLKDNLDSILSAYCYLKHHELNTKD